MLGSPYVGKVPFCGVEKGTRILTSILLNPCCRPRNRNIVASPVQLTGRTRCLSTPISAVQQRTLRYKALLKCKSNLCRLCLHFWTSRNAIVAGNVPRVSGAAGLVSNFRPKGTAGYWFGRNEGMGIVSCHSILPAMFFSLATLPSFPATQQPG